MKRYSFFASFVAIATMYMIGEKPNSTINHKQNSNLEEQSPSKYKQLDGEIISDQPETISETIKEVQKEVLSQLLEQLTDQEELLKKRSHCCTCICPSKNEFFGDDRPLELCNIDLGKIAAEELLVTESACFDGSVCFAGNIEGLPGWFCWNPVECTEWTELNELPPSCFPQCGEMVLDTFNAARVERVAFSYQTKDGIDALAYLLPITLTIANLIILYDGSERSSIIPRTRTAKIIQDWHDDAENCFLAIELGIGTGFGSYNEASCICQARTI